MTYTKKQRRKIYETALNYFLLCREADKLCPAMIVVIGWLNEKDVSLHKFKELAQGLRICHASDLLSIHRLRNSRIKALEKAIELTY